MSKPQRKPPARRAAAVVASNDNAAKGPGVAKVRLLPTPLEQLATAIRERNAEKNAKKRAKLAAKVDEMKTEMTARTLSKLKGSRR